MSYVAPTAADMKARFAWIAPVADATVTTFLAEAIAQVGETWIESDRRLAQMYLCAHLMQMEGEPGASIAVAAGGNASPSSGAEKSRRVGDVAVEVVTGIDISGGGYGRSSAGYELTEYGRRFRALMAKNFPGIAVV